MAATVIILGRTCSTAPAMMAAWRVVVGERLARGVALRAQLGHGVVQVDQHHHAGFRGDAGERDEADRDGDGEIEAEPPHQPQAADQRERHREHDDERLGHATEVEIEQQE
jgi:hypothetical protein